MDGHLEIAQLKAQVEKLTAENAALREAGFRGSKAEALMVLEYDRIPTFLKSHQAIAWQRKIATAVMVVVPLILVAVAVFGGLYAYRDHQQLEEMRRLQASVEHDFWKDPALKAKK